MGRRVGGFKRRNACQTEGDIFLFSLGEISAGDVE